MKIIDLLNKIANGEEPPEKIKFHNYYCYYRPIKNQYTDFKNEPILEWDYIVMNSLNDEVEIIEEYKKIEKLDIQLSSDDENKVNCYRANNLQCDMAFKINEIIEVLNDKNRK